MLEARDAHSRDSDRLRGPPRRSLQDEPQDHLGGVVDGVAPTLRGTGRVKGNRRWWTAAAVVMLFAATQPALALDNAAWRTFIRPVAFTDLHVTERGVLGATQEGGLLRW